MMLCFYDIKIFSLIIKYILDKMVLLLIILLIFFFVEEKFNILLEKICFDNVVY